MSAHALSMHFARYDCKRLLHRSAKYAPCMETPNDRLRKARARHFSSAAEAARAMGIPEGTYAGHENGHRGFPAKRAPKYAKRFKTTPEWLLYGKGQETLPDPVPSEDVLQQMIREAIESEVPVETKLGDLPRILGSNLREQLERYAADPQVVDFWERKLARGIGAQSHPATNEGVEGESRTA
jgi:DNA-binding XRE family transcriptional regulator